MLFRSQLWKENGHDVCEVLVGTSSEKNIPDFFYRPINCSIKSFDSPHFVTNKKSISITKTLFKNLRKTKKFIDSISFVKEQIVKNEPDVVINFYDVIGGIAFGLNNLSPKFICIGHQYLFLNNSVNLKKINKIELFYLNIFTLFTSLKADKILALSFSEHKSKGNITVIPPILREDVLNLKPKKEDYLLGYMVYPNYDKQIIKWHSKNPNEKINIFWTKDDKKINDNLHFHKINDNTFIHFMENCKGYVTTGGFESICEAMYLDKPILMIPTHIEQQCNVEDAKNSGAGIGADKFDIDKLIDFIPKYTKNKGYKEWVKDSKSKLLLELTK